MEEIDDASHRETASAVLMENRRFIVKLADTPAEVEQALHLRYEVFKLEQGRLAELDGSAGQIDRFLAAKLHGRAPEEAEKRRLTSALLRRGFSWGDIREAWGRLGAEIPEE